MREEAKESIISIIFAYTCLEAYINMVGIDNLDEDWKRYEGSSTEDKWIGIPKTLTKRKFDKPRSVFNKGKDPFKSFLRLQGIRRYLVHLKPDFELPAYTKYGHTDPILNTVNCETAVWACGIAPDMVHKLDDLIKRPYPIWIK